MRAGPRTFAHWNAHCFERQKCRLSFAFILLLLSYGLKFTLRRQQSNSKKITRKLLHTTVSFHESVRFCFVQPRSNRGLSFLSLSHNQHLYCRELQTTHRPVFCRCTARSRAPHRTRTPRSRFDSRVDHALRTSARTNTYVKAMPFFAREEIQI